MNVWAINKELRIKHLLYELVNRYGENVFALREHPEQFQAVEIYDKKNPQLSVYVYTFAQSSDKYAIDLMYPVIEHSIIGESENQSLEQVLQIIRTHFDK